MFDGRMQYKPNPVAHDFVVSLIGRPREDFLLGAPPHLTRREKVRLRHPGQHLDHDLVAIVGTGRCLARLNFGKHVGDAGCGDQPAPGLQPLGRTLLAVNDPHAGTAGVFKASLRASLAEMMAAAAP